MQIKAVMTPRKLHATWFPQSIWRRGTNGCLNRGEGQWNEIIHSWFSRRTDRDSRMTAVHTDRHGMAVQERQQRWLRGSTAVMPYHNGSKCTLWEEARLECALWAASSCSGCSMDFVNYSGGYSEPPSWSATALGFITVFMQFGLSVSQQHGRATGWLLEMECIRSSRDACLSVDY